MLENILYQIEDIIDTMKDNNKDTWIMSIEQLQEWKEILQQNC